MEITTESENGVLIARAEGRIDGANARDFGSAMLAAVRECKGAFIIDCEELSYISSAGLRAMLLIAKALAKREAPFALCSLSDPVAEIFQISGFDQIISIHRSRDEALGTVGG